MTRRVTRGIALLVWIGLATSCATDIGTGETVVDHLKQDYPISVGRLVHADVEPSRRLRIYLQLCLRNDGPGYTCTEDDQRMLAVIESGEKKLLKRLAHQYLAQGSEMPVYVYGPHCDGLGEMVLIPRCQTAIALGVWDPHLRDYIVYSTLHGDSMVSSPEFENLIEVTARATGVAKNAAKLIP